MQYELRVTDSGTGSTFVEVKDETSGARGASAYEVAVMNGFQGPVKAWLASLRGTSSPYQVSASELEALHPGVLSQLTDILASEYYAMGEIGPTAMTLAKDRMNHHFLDLEKLPLEALELDKDDIMEALNNAQ